MQGERSTVPCSVCSLSCGGLVGARCPLGFCLSMSRVEGALVIRAENFSDVMSICPRVELWPHENLMLVLSSQTNPHAFFLSMNSSSEEKAIDRSFVHSP